MSDDVLDCVGIGFGPANLALAIAIDEHNATAAPGDRLRAVFLERQGAFGWHRGMLLDDATMQVSFLKDLVTQRNPASGFSFVAYLHARGRLADFINHKTLFPLRLEFHDYLEWAAARMAHAVRYGVEVTDVVPVHDPAGDVVAFDVPVAGGGTVRARNVVLAAGLRARLPEGVRESARVWHNHALLQRMAGADLSQARRFVVVGAGQSAAEVAGFLHQRHPQAEVCAVFQRFGYSPADDSPFANRIFDPAAVDTYFGAPQEVKDMLDTYHRGTNYSCVDLDLIDDLYRRVYTERVQGRERLRVMNTSRVTALREGPAGVQVDVADLAAGTTATLDADAIVYATGYSAVPLDEVLGGAAPLCVRDAQGRPQVARDYRLATVPGTRAGLYLQGDTEASHGLSSTLLSTMAVRVGEIAASVLARRTADAAAAVPPAPAGGVTGAVEPEPEPVPAV